MDVLASRGDAAGRRKREDDVKRLGRGIVAMRPPPTERSDRRIKLSTVGVTSVGVGHASSVGTVERRGMHWDGSSWSENSVAMTGAALSQSTVMTG